MHSLSEHSSNYSTTIGVALFYSKEEATNLNADIAHSNTFKSFKYKSKLLENTEADGKNGILRNGTISMPF